MQPRTCTTQSRELWQRSLNPTRQLVCYHTPTRIGQTSPIRPHVAGILHCCFRSFARQTYTAGSLTASVILNLLVTKAALSESPRITVRQRPPYSRTPPRRLPSWLLRSVLPCAQTTRSRPWSDALV